MNVLNYTTLRTNLKEVLDNVIEENELVIINRGAKNVVMISLDEYNAWQETIYLLKSKANRDRLERAIDRANKNEFVEKDLITD